MLKKKKKTLQGMSIHFLTNAKHKSPNLVKVTIINV